MYTAWDIWKERSQGTFQKTSEIAFYKVLGFTEEMGFMKQKPTDAQMFTNVFVRIMVPRVSQDTD